MLEVECKNLQLETTQNEWILEFECCNNVGKTTPFFSLAFVIQSVKPLTAFDQEQDMIS